MERPPPHKVPTRTRAAVWERYIAISVPHTVHMPTALYKVRIKKSEINIYYTSDMLYFLKKFPKPRFRISVEM